MKTTNVIILTSKEWLEIEKNLSTLNELQSYNCYTKKQIEDAAAKLEQKQEIFDEIVDDTLYQKDRLEEEKTSLAMRELALKEGFEKLKVQRELFREDIRKAPFFVKWFLKLKDYGVYETE